MQNNQTIDRSYPTVASTTLRPQGRPRPARLRPAPLLAVEEAILSVQGIIGVTHDGQRITDAHHSEHPRLKKQQWRQQHFHRFSVCYQDMRDKFGDHMTDGVAGENILIESECTFSIDDLIGGFVIHSASDQRIT